MPHHGNEEEHNASAGQERGQNGEPVIRDNRKVDPVTGQARHPEGGQSAPGAGAQAGAAQGAAGAEGAPAGEKASDEDIVDAEIVDEDEKK